MKLMYAQQAMTPFFQNNVKVSVFLVLEGTFREPHEGYMGEVAI